MIYLIIKIAIISAMIGAVYLAYALSRRDAKRHEIEVARMRKLIELSRADYWRAKRAFAPYEAAGRKARECLDEPNHTG